MTIRGIGGVFFKSANPDAVASWYEEHLGVHRDAEGYTIFGWRDLDRPSHIGQTVWSAFPDETEYFSPSNASWMVNYRVDDLDAELARLEAEGVTLVGEPQEFEYGRFGWGLDCDGNKFELWEPPSSAPFPVTVPQAPDQELGGVWLCDPGETIAATGEETDPVAAIVKERVVSLPRAEVWRIWTTGEGLAEWLVENSRVDLRIGGPYEFYFDPDQEQGMRGGEGCKVLSFLAPRLLSFTWNAPPHLDHTRSRHTQVLLELEQVDAGTRVRLTHTGWPRSDVDSHKQWAETIGYFEKAWESVMDALERHAGK